MSQAPREAFRPLCRRFNIFRDFGFYLLLLEIVIFYYVFKFRREFHIHSFFECLFSPLPLLAWH